MYRWLLPPKLIIASLLSSDWIIFWHHHHSHILGSMTVIIILKVNFSWKGGDIEIICVWKSKVWAESTHYEVKYIFLTYNENFWGKYSLFMYTYDFNTFSKIRKYNYWFYFLAHSRDYNLIFLLFSRTIFRIMRGFTFYHTHALMPDLYTYS